MLPRAPASLSRSAYRPTVRQASLRHATQQGAVSARLRRWLSAPGSLTARLRAHGPVTVRVTQQGHGRLWPQEQAALGCRHGHVREVVLHINGQPAVWARSTAPVRSVKGPWRAIKGLGTRPLAELLFAQRDVRRGPLTGERFVHHSPQRHHLARQWRQLTQAAEAETPGWSRRSVFWRRGHPLQVLESFAPWVTRLLTER